MNHIFNKEKTPTQKQAPKKNDTSGIINKIKHTIHLIRTSTRFRHGSMATVMTVIFFLFVVLLNMAVMKMK